MRFIRFIQRALIHICMICSLIMLVVHILDWYNPFMDFSGHTVLALYILCGGSILSGLIFTATDCKQGKRGQSAEGRH